MNKENFVEGISESWCPFPSAECERKGLSYSEGKENKRRVAVTAGNDLKGFGDISPTSVYAGFPAIENLRTVIFKFFVSNRDSFTFTDRA